VPSARTAKRVRPRSMPTLRSVSGTQAASACGQPHVRAVAEPACPAWCRCGSGGGGVADPLRRVRSVVAVRDGNDRVAVPAAQGRVGVCVRRPSAVGAVGAVSVDHRGRCRARVADVGVGRDEGDGLHEAGRRLPAVGEGLGEMQGSRDERGDRRRDHRLPGRSPHAAARQIRHRRTLSVRRPHHHPGPGGRCSRHGLFTARSTCSIRRTKTSTRPRTTTFSSARAGRATSAAPIHAIGIHDMLGENTEAAVEEAAQATAAHLDRPLENYRREIQRRLFG
jgi:hypothetical protein